MLALFSKLVRWLKPDGVRALGRDRPIPMRSIVGTHTFQDELAVHLECGHTTYLGLGDRATGSLPCYRCAGLVRAETPVRRETKNPGKTSV